MVAVSGGNEYTVDHSIYLMDRGGKYLGFFPPGSSAQQPRAINCVMAYTFAMTAYAVRCVLLPVAVEAEGGLPGDCVPLLPADAGAQQPRMLMNGLQHCRKNHKKAQVLVRSLSRLEKVEPIEIRRVGGDGH